MFRQPTQPPNQLAFSADLAFLLCIPWLLVWRIELPEVLRPGSLWGGFWPLLAAGGLVLLAFVIGQLQRSPRGFLPYALRWIALALVLVLPLWTIVSLVELKQQAATLRGPALIARAEAQQAISSASSPEERARFEDAFGAAENAIALIDAVELAEQRGVEVPRVDLESLPEFEGVDADALDPAAREVLEFGLGMADALEGGDFGEDFGEFEDIVHELGLDNPAVQAALVALLAPVLGPMLGLSVPVTAALLEGLFAGGKLTMGGMMRVGASLAGASLPGGGFDEAKLMEDFERYGELADAAATIIEEAERVGGDKVRNSEGVQMLKRTAREASGRSPADEPRAACPQDKVQAARRFAGGKPDLLRRQLENMCPNIEPDALERLVAG